MSVTYATGIPQTCHPGARCNNPDCFLFGYHWPEDKWQQRKQANAPDQRRLSRSGLLAAAFLTEVHDLENQNQHTLKQWRIAKQAGLADLRREFADIEAEHFLSKTGITNELRARRNAARAEMWKRIEVCFGASVASKLRASI